ncbi:MAG TPA: hypothetical protein VFF43_09670, partial [Caldimonas sp.]|nr:hypothetical protein [Caldimonas sp.]
MWFKVDDGFYHHPKWLGASDAEIALWTRAGAWSAQTLTDGAIPPRAFAEVRLDVAVADSLVERRLWERCDDGGYQFHDWTEYQPAREMVLTRRKANRERRAKWLADRANAVHHAVHHAVTNDVTNDVTSPVMHGVANAPLRGGNYARNSIP